MKNKEGTVNVRRECKGDQLLGGVAHKEEELCVMVDG